MAPSLPDEVTAYRVRHLQREVAVLDMQVLRLRDAITTKDKIIARLRRELEAERESLRLLADEGQRPW